MKLFAILDTLTGRTTGTTFGPKQKAEAKKERDELNEKQPFRFCVTKGPDHPHFKEGD